MKKLLIAMSLLLSVSTFADITKCNYTFDNRIAFSFEVDQYGGIEFMLRDEVYSPYYFGNGFVLAEAQSNDGGSPIIEIVWLNKQFGKEGTIRIGHSMSPRGTMGKERGGKFKCK